MYDVFEYTYCMSLIAFCGEVNDDEISCVGRAQEPFTLPTCTGRIHEPNFNVSRLCCLCRSRAYNTSTCERMDGYKHSDGYCYFTFNNCSAYYINCRCYFYYSTSYTNATCINLRGDYVYGHCYYNNGLCLYYWYRRQCYNRLSPYHQSYNCPGVYDYSTGYCYYNI